MTAVPPVWPAAPRHLPSRELPPYAYVPGRTPHPVNSPEGHLHGLKIEPSEPVHVPANRWREDDDYLWGIDLYHAGYLWEAHEAWEGIWKASPDPAQRELLQSLIQLAAALLKVRAQEPAGSRKLGAAALKRLRGLSIETPEFMGLDLAPLAARIEACLAQEPLDWSSGPRLVVRL